MFSAAVFTVLLAAPVAEVAPMPREVGPTIPLGPLGDRPRVDAQELRRFAEQWGTLPAEKRAQIVADLTRNLPQKFEPMIKSYFEALDKKHGYKK